MPPIQYDVTDADDLTKADKQILDELHAGARTKKAIVDATGLHRNTVGNRLDVLEAADIINCIHETTALYELVEDPRADEGDQKTNISTEDVVDDYLYEHYGFGVDDLEDQLADQDELRAVLVDAREAYENVNGNGVEDALDRMEAVLDGE